MSRPKKWHRDHYREAIWKPNALRPNEKLVALAYAEYAGQEDVSWVTWTTLSDMTGMRSKVTLSAATKGLVDAGWMTMIEPARQHRSPRYKLTIPDNPEVRNLYRWDDTEPPSRGTEHEPLSTDPEVQNMDP